MGSPDATGVRRASGTALSRAEGAEALANVHEALANPLWQISYSAISEDLSDKLHFPGVLRTVPGADHQIEAMVQLMLYFRWNWIIVLMSSDDYGRDNSRLLSQRLAHHDICIAFQETLPMTQPNRNMTQLEREHLEAVVGKLRRSTARVVVVFSPDLSLYNFFREVLRQNFTGAVWIASESWAIDLVLHNVTELQRTGTFLGIATQAVSVPGFSEFRVRRSQGVRPALNRSSQGATCNQECDSCMNTTESFNTMLTLSGERTVFSVYSAVYAVAHALHNLLGCNQISCRKEVVYPWQVRPRAWKHGPSEQAQAQAQARSLWLPWRRPKPFTLASPSFGGFWANRLGRPWDMPCLQTHRNPSW